MIYTITKKLEKLYVHTKEDGTKKLRADYTVTGTGLHKGTDIAINEGITVERAIPAGVFEDLDAKADLVISTKYIND
jgi:hypothetical protein